MANINSDNIINECRKFISEIKTKNILVALSGGLDSSVLLHIMHVLSRSLPIRVRAVHINHNLSKNSKIYEDACKQITSNYDIEFISKNIFLETKSNIEEQCRIKRYEEICNTATSDEYILTAHHMDDQVETFFLKLMRGSSPNGLSGIKKFGSINNHEIGRPLIDISRLDLEAYQKINNLSYVVDDTNNNEKFDRNYLRKKIIPLLHNRWPSINKVMKKNIPLQGFHSKLAANYVNEFLPKVYGKNENEILIDKLLELPDDLKFTLLHEWVKNKYKLALSLDHLYEIIKFLSSSNDSNSLFSYNALILKKYKNTLFFHTPSDKQQDEFISWDLKKDLKFNSQLIKISILKNLGLYGFLLENKPISVRTRKGGEKIKINAVYSQSLKKIFQSKNIPPWERESYALIFAKEELVALYNSKHVILSNIKH